MSVRAKFKVDAIERTKYGSVEMQTVKLSPVYGGDAKSSEENKKFWAASPSGSIQLGCVNAEAAKLFELGAEYYIDFTPAG